MDFELMMAKIFGTKHEREVKAMRPMIAAINDLEPQMQALSDEELAAQTVRLPRAARARRHARRPADSRPSPPCAKPAAASSTCGISMSS